MFFPAAVNMITIQNVLGISNVLRTEKIEKNCMIYTRQNANVRLGTILVAQSTTNQTVSPTRILLPFWSQMIKVNFGNKIKCAAVVLNFLIVSQKNSCCCGVRQMRKQFMNQFSTLKI